MNHKATPHPHVAPIAQPIAQHLTHDQLCDVLLHDDLDVHALNGDTLVSIDAADQLAACQEHLRNCLICSAELETMRSAVARFQIAADALVSRELARHPLPASFHSVYAARTRKYSVPAFVWAAAALLVGLLIPLSLLHLKPTPLLNRPPVASQSTSSSTAAAVQTPDLDSDAALLEAIDQHLSASVPEPMQPLANSVAPAETVSTRESN